MLKKDSTYKNFKGFKSGPSTNYLERKNKPIIKDKGPCARVELMISARFLQKFVINFSIINSVEHWQTATSFQSLILYALLKR